MIGFFPPDESLRRVLSKGSSRWCNNQLLIAKILLQKGQSSEMLWFCFVTAGSNRYLKSWLWLMIPMMILEAVIYIYYMLVSRAVISYTCIMMIIQDLNSVIVRRRWWKRTTPALEIHISPLCWMPRKPGICFLSQMMKYMVWFSGCGVTCGLFFGGMKQEDDKDENKDQDQDDDELGWFYRSCVTF